MGFVVNQHRRALRRNLSGFAAAYVLALSLIAIIACASHWISLRVTTSQVNAANEIDISGAQRMLSQRIALLLTDLETTADRSATLAELRSARDRFRSAHLGLINGDPAMRLNGIQSRELGDIYFYEPHLVNERTETLIFAADRALLNRAPLPAATLAAATALAKGPLLAGLNAVVKRREMDARRGLEFNFGTFRGFRRASRCYDCHAPRFIYTRKGCRPGLILTDGECESQPIYAW